MSAHRVSGVGPGGGVPAAPDRTADGRHTGNSAPVAAAHTNDGDDEQSERRSRRWANWLDGITHA